MLILFVCTGNTCRSPMAAAIFADILKKRGVKNIECESAGIAAAGGAPAAGNAAAVMGEMGPDISAHRSRGITEDMLQKADLIVCMSQGHAELLKKHTDETKLRLLGGGVPDPFGGDTDIYRACRDAMIPALQKLADEIENGEDNK